MSATAKSPLAAGRPSTGWNSACASRIRSTTFDDFLVGRLDRLVLDRDPLVLAGVDRRLQVELRLEADRPGRVPLQLVDVRPAEDRELALLDRGRERVGQRSPRARRP